MKQDNSVLAFKNMLRNYNYFLSAIEELQFQIEDCYDKLGASPKSIRYDIVQTHTPPNKNFEYKMREYIEIYANKKKFFESNIEYIESVLDKIEEDTRKMCTDVFVQGRTLVDISDDYYISPSGARKRINKAIKKALESI